MCSLSGQNNNPGFFYGYTSDSCQAAVLSVWHSPVATALAKISISWIIPLLLPNQIINTAEYVNGKYCQSGYNPCAERDEAEGREDSHAYSV
jgi:hypothetical protein